jgi:hypothetical protein
MHLNSDPKTQEKHMQEVNKMQPETENCSLYEDCVDAVYKDRYMWVCIWSPPRKGKTTLAGDILHHIYKEVIHDTDKAWDHVLQATIFTLEQAIHRLKFGVPCREYTCNGLHNRVPAINWDDFGAYSNKATTQHSEAWDDFKGGFDVLGTKIAVLLSTMVDPSEPTFQLNNKFTHEIQITSLGNYKYDEIMWQQDFRSNRIRIKKHCIEMGSFSRWPDWVYAEYDKQRCSLADEVFQRIEDKISVGAVDYTLKTMKPQDSVVLRVLDSIGAADKDVVVSRLEKQQVPYDADVMMRLKSHNLIIPTRMPSGHYKYDLTQLGRDVLAALDAKKTKEMLPEEFLRSKT